MASAPPKATGAVHFTMGSVMSTVGTSNGDGSLLIPNSGEKVGASALKRKSAEHTPPSTGSATGRIRLVRPNLKRARHLLQGVAAMADSARALEATTRNCRTSSGGGVRLGSERTASRIR